MQIMPKNENIAKNAKQNFKFRISNIYLYIYNAF